MEMESSKEAKAQVNVGVGIEVLWRAIAKDLRYVLPRVVPNVVKAVELIQGDGGLGSVFLFTFGQDTEIRGYQKEKLVVCDEEQHEFGMQVVEGGHLNHGFSYYTTLYKLTKIAESETLVDVKVFYETEAEEEETSMPGDTTKACLGVLKRLEHYLLKQEL